MPYDGDIHEGISSPVVGKILEDISATQNTYRAVAAEKMNMEIQVYADQYNLGKKLGDEVFKTGDLVLMKDHSPPGKSEVKKFKRFKWQGPFIVTSRPYPGVYMLKWKATGKKWQSPMAQEQLKAYIENEEEPDKARREVSCHPHTHPTDMANGEPGMQSNEERPIDGEATLPRQVSDVSGGGNTSKRTAENAERSQLGNMVSILNKRIRKSGERQYEVVLADGKKKWMGADDVPLALIPEFESRWQRRQDLKKKRESPFPPSKGTRRSARNKVGNVNSLSFFTNVVDDSYTSRVPSPPQTSFWIQTIRVIILCIIFHVCRTEAKAGFSTMDRLRMGKIVPPSWTRNQSALTVKIPRSTPIGKEVQED
jgi:hypothetical protein